MGAYIHSVGNDMIGTYAQKIGWYQSDVFSGVGGGAAPTHLNTPLFILNARCLSSKSGERLVFGKEVDGEAFKVKGDLSTLRAP